MRSDARFNLALMFVPNIQEEETWLDVKARIETQAPDIDTRIVNQHSPGAENFDWMRSRPTLAFTPFDARYFTPPRGRTIGGTAISKDVEIERLTAAGIPVPRTLRLTADTSLEALAGDFLIVKPTDSLLGHGVRLAAVGDIAKRFSELTRDGLRSTIVQEFIDVELDGGRPVEYRVHIAFGRPFCAMRRSWAKPRPPLDEIAGDPAAIIATSNPTIAGPWTPFKDEPIVALALSTAPVFAEIPCLGVDIVRERRTGKLYVLEVDTRGNDITIVPRRGAAAEERAPFLNQFGGLDAIAADLAERTRADAV